jgi:hypothetical protein
MQNGPDIWAPEAVTCNAHQYPDRILLYKPPKWGGTAFASWSEPDGQDIVFLMTKGEDGLLTLKKAGLVRPEVRHFPRCAQTWPDLLRAVAGLLKQPPPTFVLDTLNGAETLCHSHVCQTVFGGDWGDKGFGGYQQGYRLHSPPEWERLLNALDMLREAGSRIICLCHSARKTVKNPHGSDYDASLPALHEETWKVTARRFDVILYGGYEQAVTKAGPRERKGKATGGNHRIIYAQPAAAYEAGGRYNLPPEIDCGETAADAWHNFLTALHPNQGA